MSTGGALFTIRDISASIHLQPAYIVIKTPVSFLELQGVVVRTLPGPGKRSTPHHEGVRRFVYNQRRQDRNVLRSLLEGLPGRFHNRHLRGFDPSFRYCSQSPHPNLPSRGAHNGTPRDDSSHISPSRGVCRVTRLDQPTPTGAWMNLSLDGACLELPEGFDPTELTPRSRATRSNQTSLPREP